MLVTGGAGFIGSNIAERLLSLGESVTILDDFSTGREENLSGLGGDLEVIRGDVCDSATVARAMRGVGAVLHHAAVASVARSIDAPLRCDEVNVGGTLRILEAARAAGVRRVVYAASAAAYGDEPTLPKREDMVPVPLSPYAVSKLAGEHYVTVYAGLHGLHAVALRYFNVFGARQDPASEYAAAIPKFAHAIISGKRPTVFGDGEQTRDFCHVDNVVDANLLALERDEASGHVINIAGGSSVSINALIGMLTGIVGVEGKPRHVEARPGDIKHSRADISNAHALLGWSPRVSVEEGLRRTIDSMRSVPRAG